jgi:hypothetical protein
MDQDTEHRWCQYCMAKTNKFSFFFQKWQHTSVEDSTNVLFVEKKWLQGRRSSSESVYLKKSDQN